MRNPWLDIPLMDYEQHMALPTIGQSQLIANLLETLVKRYSPRSVAILGCAGGNGFDRLVGTSVTRVVGVDINRDTSSKPDGVTRDVFPALSCTSRT